MYWHTLEILGLASDQCNKPNTAKRKSQDFFGFPVHIKVMFKLYYSLVSVK